MPCRQASWKIGQVNKNLQERERTTNSVRLWSLQKMRVGEAGKKRKSSVINFASLTDSCEQRSKLVLLKDSAKRYKKAGEMPAQKNHRWKPLRRSHVSLIYENQRLAGKFCQKFTFCLLIPKKQCPVNVKQISNKKPSKRRVGLASRENLKNIINKKLKNCFKNVISNLTETLAIRKHLLSAADVDHTCCEKQIRKNQTYPSQPENL